MTDTRAGPDSGLRPRAPTRILLAGAAGNFVELFDLTLYGISATVIASTFFPGDGSATALLGTFAIYGLAFVARPLGGIVFGRIGDRRGRRSALCASVLLMGVTTAAVGLLPGWSRIGVLAPVLLLVCRLLQGFSAGGEYAGAMTFNVEHAPPGRRALWMSLTAGSTLLGVAGATVTVVVFQLVAGDAFAAGGWRWPFLVGGLLSVVALVLRLCVDETPVFTQLAEDEGARPGRSYRHLVRTYWRSLLVLLCYFGVDGVVVHMFLGYLPTYLGTAAGISSTTALAVITGLTVFFALVWPVFGVVQDRIGRRPMLCAGAVAAVVATVPAYLLIGTRSMVGVAAGSLVLMVVVGLLGAGGTAVIEMLPADVRFSGVALPYNAAYAVFGGTAPLVSQALVDASGNLLAPAFYATVIALVGAPVILRGIPETRGIDLRVGVVTS